MGESKLEQSIEESQWYVLQIGSFDGVYKFARSRGYIVVDILKGIDGGLKLHIPSSPKYASITPDKEMWNSWILLAFDNEDLLKEVIFTDYRNHLKFYSGKAKF